MANTRQQLTASKLIAQLEKLVQKHGDLLVWLDVNAGKTGAQGNVLRLKVHHGGAWLEGTGWTTRQGDDNEQ